MQRKLIKLTVLTIGIAFLNCASHAQNGVWQPTPGHKQIPIWPGRPPNAQPVEKNESMTIGKRLYGGKPITGIDDVSKPTITVYSPKGKNTGVAVLISPGGGYRGLAIDLE